jgi:hypothetical protein
MQFSFLARLRLQVQDVAHVGLDLDLERLAARDHLGQAELQQLGLGRGVVLVVFVRLIRLGRLGLGDRRLGIGDSAGEHRHEHHNPWFLARSHGLCAGMATLIEGPG